NSNLDLQDLLPVNHIHFTKNVMNIEEAIQLAAEPLVKMRYIDNQYIDLMNNAFDDTYMVINQNITIPHADGEDTVNRTSMSMFRLYASLILSTALDVYIFVVIAAADKFKHLRSLLLLTDLSQDTQNIQRISQTQAKREVYEIIKHYSKID